MTVICRSVVLEGPESLQRRLLQVTPARPFAVDVVVQPATTTTNDRASVA